MYTAIPSQDMDIYRQMSWCFVFNDWRWCVVFRFIDIGW